MCSSDLTDAVMFHDNIVHDILHGCYIMKHGIPGIGVPGETCALEWSIAYYEESVKEFFLMKP